MPKCWNPAREAISRDEMCQIQSKNLIETVNHVYQNVPFYRKKMDEKGLLPGDIKSIDDLSKLPITNKQDLRDNYPFGLFAVPMDDIVRIHASSGTTGKQTVVGYTKEDLDVWGEVMARTLTAAGADKSWIIHVSYGYGLFTGGLGAHIGAETIGAAVIPASSGNTARQIQIMTDFGSNLLACTPSYAMYLAESIEKAGIPKEKLKLRAGVFGAEPWTPEMRKRLEEKLGILAIDVYGLSEIIGPGVSYECPEQNGLHVCEDHFIPEIINPETEEVLGDGEHGALLFSTVTKRGLPLLRYNTRDVSSLNHETCECGRTAVRMEKPCGRTDDMLIIRGVNVFPSQVESVLLNIGNVEPHYLLIVDRVNALDTLEIWVEMSEGLFSDEVRQIEVLENKIAGAVKSTLGVAAKIKLVEPNTIERSEGKTKRVIDKRKF